MVWGLTLISLLAFLLGFASHSPSWLGFGVLVGFISGLAAALMFIDRHMRASSRPEYMTEGQFSALRNAVHKPGEPPAQLPPSQPH